MESYEKDEKSSENPKLTVELNFVCNTGGGTLVTYIVLLKTEKKAFYVMLFCVTNHNILLKKLRTAKTKVIHVVM